MVSTSENVKAGTGLSEREVIVAGMNGKRSKREWQVIYYLFI